MIIRDDHFKDRGGGGSEGLNPPCTKPYGGAITKAIKNL